MAYRKKYGKKKFVKRSFKKKGRGKKLGRGSYTMSRMGGRL